MSSLGSLSSLNYNPFQLLALLDSQSASSASGAASASSTAAASATTSAAATAGTGSTSLWNQLTTAFNNAIQNAEQTGNTSNLASVLQTAGNQVLKNNGINPATFEQQVSGQAQGAHHHHHHHGGWNSSSQTSGDSLQTSGTSTAAGSTTGATASTTSTAAAQETSSQQLSDLLAQLFGTSNGVLINQQA